MRCRDKSKCLEDSQILPNLIGNVTRAEPSLGLVEVRADFNILEYPSRQTKSPSATKEQSRELAFFHVLLVTGNMIHV